MKNKESVAYQSTEYREKFREVKEKYEKAIGKKYADSTFYKLLRRYRKRSEQMNLSSDIFSPNFLKDLVKFSQTLEKLGQPPKNLTSAHIALTVFDSFSKLNQSLTFEDFTDTLDDYLKKYFVNISTTKKIPSSTYHGWFTDACIDGFTKVNVNSVTYKWHTDNLKYVAYKAARWVLNKKYPDYSGTVEQKLYLEDTENDNA